MSSSVGDEVAERRLERQLMRVILSNLEPLAQAWLRRRPVVWPLGELGELGWDKDFEDNEDLDMMDKLSKLSSLVTVGACERGTSDETSNGGTNDDGADRSKPDSVADWSIEAGSGERRELLPTGDLEDTAGKALASVGKTACPFTTWTSREARVASAWLRALVAASKGSRSVLARARIAAATSRRAEADAGSAMLILSGFGRLAIWRDFDVVNLTEFDALKATGYWHRKFNEIWCFEIWRDLYALNSTGFWD